MRKILASLLFCCLSFGIANVFAQDLKTEVTKNKELDSARKKAEAGADSVIFNSKYIRYTTHKLTKDSIQTIPIDTGLTGIQNFSLIAQPRRPTAGTGVLGLAARPLLFEPVKTIGFDAGFHALDFYMLNHEDVKFYRARSPFTNLYYVNAGDKEQVLKLLHTQNINKNWNFGANFNRIGANGAYTHQRGDHLNASVFTWYQSPNKRYTLWFDGVFNTLKAEENGSPVNDTIFKANGDLLVDKLAEPVRLSTARQLWRKNSWMLKQSYFVGRIDSTGITAQQSILPTNKITYTLAYTRNDYSFKKDEIDSYKVLPRNAVDSVFTNDSTNVKHVMNEFIYSFFLRAKGTSLIKNELKIDAGIRHDFYKYGQYGILRDTTRFYSYETSFQNITLLGSLGYRFSNRIDFNLDLQQIFQGENTGDFLYEAKSNLLLSKNVGRIVLGAYLQNKSPEQLFNRYYGNHYNWDKKFDRTKTANLSFSYLNAKYNLDANASYYLITNYLYFVGDGASGIIPTQEGGDISLLKLSLGKKFTLGTWHLDAYAVYQKTDNARVLRIPEIYTFNSLYKDQTFFKTLKTQIGVDIRYNTTYSVTAYSPAASQFYNIDEKLGSKPVVDVWVKAGLRRANLFVKYEYVNQGLFSQGYYTVKQYPMPDKLLKFGVSWNFYD
ncbi:hypothetical protein FA048_17230 [Pedobacter polaris]|uniref:Porin n=1 Tax=Pedobacter polaris TaxID=2571273 RepID=A0A4U1CG69_9SPHI|nr:putative porin [Pedobacter polaris]TKC05471.1 hypothetical protein FA048_17230 [Pedobacter polaris]